MSACCCSLAGTAACQTCSQNSFAVMSKMMTPQPTALRDIIVNLQTEKPQTNADRIRAMSDEEMATFLFNNVSCSDCTMHGGGCSVDCEKWMLSWLKAPVEEVDK